MSGSSPVDELTSVSGSGQASGKIACGSCAASNPPGGQFCAACGHALYEPCTECAKPVLLSQSFCGSCGCDLVAAVAKRKAHLEAKIADAIEAAKQRDFERSKSCLAIVTVEKDFRFKQVVANAKIAQRKIDVIAQQECETASDRIAAAQQAYEVGDSARVVQLLGQLSPNLLTEEAKSNLERSRSHLEQVEQTEKALHEAFAQRDWVASGAILDRMMELKPDDPSVTKLAVKVGKKLVAKAVTLRQAHKYSAAFEVLQCVPSNARDAQYEQLNETVDRISWLSAQFVGEPFATPALGRLAKQWVEQSGGDPRANKMLANISKRIKEQKSSPRELFAPLDGNLQSWAGGPVGILAFPTCVDLGDQGKSIASPGQFNVAIGLALQGLGLGRVKEDFAPKKGLLQRLGRKKSARCWGLDIGASGIKAVCLEVTDNERARIINSYKLNFNTPLTRTITESTVNETIRESVEAFLSENDVETIPVWASFPARELVSRFVKLPPVADKQVKVLFDKEVESRIPLPMDEIVSVGWIAPLPDDAWSAIGRAAFVAAAKKQFVDRYLENLSEAGLTVSGLQATPIALLNFTALEFADQLEVTSEDNDDLNQKLPAITIFDCGAEMTTVLLLSGKSCWFWSFESGGNEFTRLISRATKTTHGDAETLKRNPASLERPHTQFEMVEQRIEEMHGRLQKVVADAASGHDEFDLQQTWCCGGGSLTHGWIKRILCKK